MICKRETKWRHTYNFFSPLGLSEEGRICKDAVTLCCISFEGVIDIEYNVKESLYFLYFSTAPCLCKRQKYINARIHTSINTNYSSKFRLSESISRFLSIYPTTDHSKFWVFKINAKSNDFSILTMGHSLACDIQFKGGKDEVGQIGPPQPLFSYSAY